MDRRPGSSRVICSTRQPGIGQSLFILRSMGPMCHPSNISADQLNPRKLRESRIAVLLAAGAFVLTMLKDPPQSVAADPTTPVAKAVDIQVPTGIPSGGDGAEAN